MYKNHSKMHETDNQLCAKYILNNYSDRIEYKTGLLFIKFCIKLSEPENPIIILTMIPHL